MWLDESLVKKFELDGFCVVPGAVDVEDLNRVRIMLSDMARQVALSLGLQNVGEEDWILHELIPKIYEMSPESGSFLYDQANRHTCVYDLLLGDGVVATIKKLLKTSSNGLTFDNLQLFINLPSVDRQVLGWHQDSDYFKFFSPSESLVCWIPLLDIDTKAGAISVIPGSHSTQLPHTQNKFGQHKEQIHERRGLTYVDTSLFDVNQAVSVPVEKGSAAFFHMNLLHKGGLNRSSFTRYNVLGRFGNALPCTSSRG